jgi:RNA polymerase sigma-70 factor, ECF subfamily
VKDGPARAVVVASPEPEDLRDKEVSELYVAYRKGVRAYLIHSVGYPEHEADDVVQDTILIVRDRWDQVRSLEKPAAYWYKIAGRRARRLQGQRARRGCGLDPHDLLRVVPSLDDPCGEVDLRAALTVLLRGLPGGQRQVLWLREAAGFSVAETAMILDLRPGTVKSQLNAAKRRLNELLRTNGGVWEAGLR